MDKCILFQCPRKYGEVIEYFCKECLKHNIFDKIYIATDYKEVPNLDDRCHVFRLKRDKQFSSNILSVIDLIPEDIVLMCCEDHIMLQDQDKSDFNRSFQFMLDNPNVGYMRLSYHDRIPFADKRHGSLFCELHPQKGYTISLQPSWWRRSFLKRILVPKEDAWRFELDGSKRARAINTKKFGCTKNIYFATNFYRKGQYIRDCFADYLKKNGLTLKNKMDVYQKYENGKKVNKIVPYDVYMRKS